jgi:hypothetical protein
VPYNEFVAFDEFPSSHAICDPLVIGVRVIRHFVSIDRDSFHFGNSAVFSTRMWWRMLLISTSARSEQVVWTRRSYGLTSNAIRPRRLRAPGVSATLRRPPRKAGLARLRWRLAPSRPPRRRGRAGERPMGLLCRSYTAVPFPHLRVPQVPFHTGAVSNQGDWT